MFFDNQYNDGMVIDVFMWGFISRFDQTKILYQL